mmetsp:Transcript_83576/g.132097  ORF Transcript_83576/g.132097 Transcript_83576/m.132097 type:complete len:121 (-) Transcript_83576:152-514(-)|eukprot:CAMPEP_0169120458 /NCGR_PEP_ID=MMETSP1015-20121227/32115_1 /TAXON_ID=342587 /ORGANISM="Karlodinium micrum, Strain CCMP2283" /LENGTH=120 /DNA_ID=CAMNT_0009183435 /DNA_START=51 /DNA_END=413 /DNA_ORIENTATION=-
MGGHGADKQASRRAAKKLLTGQKAEVARAMMSPEGVSPDVEVLDVTALELEAKKSLDVMTNEDRVALIEKMGKRVEVLMSLPGEARNKHMFKLSKEERIEFMSAQILISTIQQHMAMRAQ